MTRLSTTRRRKTIREAIHGDIRLEPHELDVINTRVFQRLHGIKQLGMAYLVYPTATHTRFEHSLGCVHVAQRIIDQLRDVGTSVTARDQLQHNCDDANFPIPDSLRDRIRMAALLHDLAHVPYGHTLEDEVGTLAEHHDSTDQRITRFFGYLREEIESDRTKDRELLIPLIKYALRTMRTIRHIDKEIRRGERFDAIDTLLASNDWFVADIIGNTICADLLDYARRDMRAIGLNQEYDDRVFSYFDLAPDDNGRVRLALRTIKQQGLRLDAVSEVLNVLRIRYTLSERVLFHHTKNIASAMLGQALSYLHFGPQAFDELRDEQLLPSMQPKPRSRAWSQKLAGRLSNWLMRWSRDISTKRCSGSGRLKRRRTRSDTLATLERTSPTLPGERGFKTRFVFTYPSLRPAMLSSTAQSHR